MWLTAGCSDTFLDQCWAIDNNQAAVWQLITPTGQGAPVQPLLGVSFELWAFSLALFRVDQDLFLLKSFHFLSFHFAALLQPLKLYFTGMCMHVYLCTKVFVCKRTDIEKCLCIYSSFAYSYLFPLEERMLRIVRTCNQRWEAFLSIRIKLPAWGGRVKRGCLCCFP